MYVNNEKNDYYSFHYYYTTNMDKGNDNNKNEEKLLVEYMNQMNELHKHAHKIAEEHLETSFDLIKSNGFKKWVSDNIKKE